jgi:cytochrome c556
MNKLVKTLALGVSMTLAGGAFAQVIGKAEDQIRWRQSAYHTMAWSMARIKANVEGTYNKDQVAEAANVIQAVANSKMGALFQPDTAKGKGWKDTRVKGEFFLPESKEEIGKIAGAYVKEANEMQKVAATGDAAAVKAQFGKLGEACKACHDKFREEEKK